LAPLYSALPDLVMSSLKRNGANGVSNSKSQIAIEYGNRIQQSTPDTWVFWVDAENVTKLEEGYREIAKALRINGASDRDADIFCFVYNWLRNEANADG
jgi:hypothetical protein